MKKQFLRGFSLMLTAAVFLSTAAYAAVQAQPIADDQFVSDVLPAGWQVNDSRLVPQAGQGLLLNTKAGMAASAECKFYRPVDGAENPLRGGTNTFTMKFTIQNNETSERQLMLGGGGTSALRFGFTGQQWWYMDAVWQKQFVDSPVVLKEGEEHELTLTAYMCGSETWYAPAPESPYTFDVAVDGQVLARGLPWMNQVDGITSFCVYTSGEGSMCVQNLDIASDATNPYAGAGASYAFGEMETLDTNIWALSAGDGNTAADYIYLGSNTSPFYSLLTVGGSGQDVVRTLDGAPAGPLAIETSFQYTGTGEFYIWIWNGTAHWDPASFQYKLWIADGNLNWADAQGNYHETGVRFSPGETYNLKLYSDEAGQNAGLYINGEKAAVDGAVSCWSNLAPTQITYSVGQGVTLRLNSLRVEKLDAVPATVFAKNLRLFAGLSAKTPLTTLENVDHVTATVDLGNFSDRDEDLLTALCVYDGNRLIGASAKTIHAKADTAWTEEWSIALPENRSENLNVKAFVWTKDLTPVIDGIEFAQ